MAAPKTPDTVHEVVKELGCISIGTPRKEAATSRLRGRVRGKVLFPEAGAAAERKDYRVKWSDEEYKALVVFLMLYTDGTYWVAHNDAKFWDQAGLFIQQQLKTAHCRSG